MKTNFQTLSGFRLLLFILAASFLFANSAECQPVKLDLKKLPKKRTLKLSEIGVADVQYIPLETSPESVIQGISKIIFGKDFLLIQNFADIKMFRYDGSFVTKIGTIGRGRNEKLIKKEIYSDTIYSWKNKGFEPYLILDVGRLRLTPSIREENDYKFIMNNFLTPVNLFEFSNFIYYEFIIPWEGKTEGLSYIGSINGNFSVLFDPEIELINDFDAGPNIWPRTVKDNSTMVVWIDAIKLKQYVISIDFKTLKPINSEKKKQLEKFALSVKETDNPIIMLIMIK